MRLQGRITQWDDDKGFGFISWHGDGSKVFVHIKAFARGSRRPALGDIVTYEIGAGKNGKSSAEKVRFSDQAQVKKPVVTKRKDSLLAVRFAVLYMGLLVVLAYFNRISFAVLVIYFTASLITFVAYGWDKSSARHGRWRTKESSLHLMGLVGGWPGALAAQRLLRHKSSKQEFLAMFWATVFLNVAALAYLAWLGDTGALYQLLERVWQDMG